MDYSGTFVLMDMSLIYDIRDIFHGLDSTSPLVSMRKQILDKMIRPCGVYTKEGFHCIHFNLPHSQSTYILSSVGFVGGLSAAFCSLAFVFVA